MKNFFTQLKYIKFYDILSIFVMLLAIPEAIFLKYKRKNLWLICERENEARDNGYWLFKYIIENYPQEDVVYAIKKNCVDYKKVKNLGEIIEYGGYKHWVYYLAAEKNISSQKGGKPNAAVCYFLEIYGLLKNKRVFLQHGVIKDDMPWCYYKNTKMRLFICGAKKEYEYLKQVYGYPKGYLQYTGLARFDGLHELDIKQNQILIMPTWRNWLERITKESLEYDDISDFSKTEYYKKWQEVLNDKEIKNKIENRNLKIIFYPHSNMQNHIKDFKTNSENIIIADSNNYEVQELLKESAFLITDYSSIFMDFGYMRKPMIYYQFDKEKFRQGQYQEGYFKYERDGFGPVVENLEELKRILFRCIDNNLEIEGKYLKKEIEFFELYDKNNCYRNYIAIKKI